MVEPAEDPYLELLDRRGDIGTALNAGFRVVDSITTPGAAVRTGASFVVADGRPGAVPA